MKRFLIIAALAAFIASCNTNSPQDIQKATEEFEAKVAAILGNPELSKEESSAQMSALYDETYALHKDDSLGLSTFLTLVTNYWEKEKALSEFAQASEMIQNDELINAKIESIQHAVNVAPGKPYIEISGLNALTGETLSIGDILKEGKPVLVDFWASWCAPCRAEIKNHLIDLAASGKVNIVGIAVWENSLDDTLNAMETLGVTWSVIYTGGRKGSPSIQYGVLGIPTLFLIAPDGTILGSGHSIEDLDIE